MTDQKLHIKNLSKKIYPLILGIGIPASLRSTVQYFQQLIDMMFLGQYSNASLTAISSISLPIWLFESLWFGLGMSTTVMVAQRLGAKKTREAAVVAQGSFIIGAWLSAFYLLMWFFLPTFIVRVMNLPADASLEAFAYLNNFRWIYLIRIVFVIVPGAILEARGFTFVLMRASLMQSAVNIILDPLLIWNFGLGTQGAALATVLAEVVGAVYISRFFWKHNILHLRTLKNLPFKWHAKERLFLAVPQSALTFSWSFVSSYTISLMNTVLPAGSAIFTVTFMLSDFTFRMLLGFDSAVTSLVGRAFGRQRLDRIRAILRAALVMKTLFGAGLVLILIIFRDPIVRLFTSDPYIGASIVQNFPWLITITIVSIYIGVFMSMLHAMGKSRWNFAVGLVVDILRFGVSYLTIILWGWGIHGAFSAILVQEAVRNVLTIVILAVYAKRYQELWGSHIVFKDDNPIVHQDEQHPFR